MIEGGKSDELVIYHTFASYYSYQNVLRPWGAVFK
jgi:hypothetical protein